MATFLIIDDSYLMRKNIKTVVESIGHKVVGEANDGKYLLKKYEELRPDLITLDIVMAEKNGLQALQELKTKHPEAKVVMVSSMAQRNKVLMAIKYGADHFVLKPIKHEKLIAVIKHIIGEEEDKEAES